jgi:hypothetical protein
MMRTRLFLLLGSASLAACMASNGDAGFTAAEQTAPPEMTIQSPTATGHVNVANLIARAAVDPKLLRTARDHLEAVAGRNPTTIAGGPAVPKALSTRSTNPDGGLFTFDALGIDGVDQALGPNQGITPPDQGLCVGNGFVLEMVNSAAQVFDITGQPVGAPIDLRALFSFPLDNPLVGFSFASDPKCYFDHASNRFFATVLRVDADTAGNLSGSQLELVVSDSADPRGGFSAFEIDLDDTGSNGTPNHAHCPCLGDQPLIGADTNGFYFSTNEFGLDPSSPGFNGAQIYALDKAKLVAGRLPTVVHLANLVLANGIGFSVQPASSPTGTGSDDNNGTEYFLSSLDFDGAGDDRIALWSLSNTASLAKSTPAVSLEHVVLKSESYAFPPPATQAQGATPLLDCLGTGTCPGVLAGFTLPATVDLLDTDDDRMNQAFFADGFVWAALNTAVQTPNAVHTGIAWFAVQPKLLSSGRVGARMEREGYVSLADADVMYPSIAVSDDGRGAIAFSLTSSTDFPSAGYARVTDARVSEVVHVAREGENTLDDASGYFSGGTARFGDYSAAMIDGNTLWMAAETVTSACTTLDCRDEFTNWGTAVSRIDLSDTLDH